MDNGVVGLLLFAWWSFSRTYSSVSRLLEILKFEVGETAERVFEPFQRSTGETDVGVGIARELEKE